MKFISIAVFLISVVTTANGQSIGAVARAERQRQQEFAGSKAVRKEIGPKPETQNVVPDADALAAEEKKVAATQRAERAELDRERATLLMKLNDVIHDRKAVQDIENRLGEIQKRSDELKQDAAPKVEAKADPGQK